MLVSIAQCARIAVAGFERPVIILLLDKLGAARNEYIPGPVCIYS